jgi:hypothetical protein
MMTLRNQIAEWLNEKGRAAPVQREAFWYRLATIADPRWAAPWYNLGLRAKYRSEWKDSLRFNQHALELDHKHEAACWNLAIAATALRNWQEARRAWKQYGIETTEGIGEVRTGPIRACVRLDPNNNGEVVWGQRLDPARIAILNVPLPASNHRFNDIVLNDGAPEGTREADGKEYPVFNELEIWEKSAYSTFEVDVTLPSEDETDRLIDLCVQCELGIEDWSTVRAVCSECSRGNLGEHECVVQRPSDLRRFAFAAKKESDLTEMLAKWKASTPGADFVNLELVLAA